jgi:hypothetical protein
MTRSSTASVLTVACLAWACGNDGPDWYVPTDTSTDDSEEVIEDCSELTDADGDTIADQHEGDTDVDGDTIPNYLDLDSDGDTIPDATEAGDSDICTRPANTDRGVDSSGNPTGDEIPDFLDTDSDNDGLSDYDEANVYGTDPRNRDSDGDGITDLGEVAAGTDPTDPTSTMDPDDFFVVLPYMAPDHEFRELDFSTDLKIADVYFLIDTTGSMSSPITNVSSSLAGTIVPALRTTIPDVQMGVGHFNDFPYGSYGGAPDEPYWNVQTITPDDSLVQTGLNYLSGADFPWGSGWDGPESHVIGVWCTATGNGISDCSAGVPPQSCPAYPDEPSPRVGYPCFRPGALPIVVMVSDADWHSDQLMNYPYDCTSTNFSSALTEMLAINARFVGVQVSTWSTSGLASMQEMARGTGSVDGTGAPLVEQSDSGTVSTSIVDMIATLATATPQDVNAIPEDEPGDPPGAEYDATIFVKDITPVSGFPDAPTGFASMDEDYFYGVVPGTMVTFEIDFYNNTVEPEDSALVFKAWIVVMGNDVTRLDERMVIIIVPTEGMGDIII